MQLSENIYLLRTARGMSQGALAEALDVSRQSVSKWENASAVPELDKLMKMSDLFEVTLDELVYGIQKNPDEKTAPVADPAQPLTIATLFSGIPPRILLGCPLLLFGMVFFLLSVFWGNQLRFGEEFGELASLSIVVISAVLLATYNGKLLAFCATVYFFYGVVSVGILHVTDPYSSAFMALMNVVLLVWFLVWGIHEQKKTDGPTADTE